MGCWYTVPTAFSSVPFQIPAAGLHLYGSDKTFMLDEIQADGRPGDRISLGRNTGSDIYLNEDRSISGLHAIIERCEGPTWKIIDESTNGLRINGEPVREPTILMLGMQIRIGKRTQLFTCDHRRLVPLGMPRSIDEMCHLAYQMFGGYSEAGRRYDLGREFIRAHAQDWTDYLMGERPYLIG